MKNRGFTLIELLAVIIILAILLLIAVPVYTNVKNNINESVYKTKIQNIKAAAETYSEETGIFIFDIKTLIENGKIEADSELGDYKDPKTNRNMKCDVINVLYENNQYSVDIKENNTCYDQSELESLFGMVELKLYKDNLEVNEVEGWTSGNSIEVRYQFKDEYQEYANNIEEIIWSGEEHRNCIKENIKDCDRYVIPTEEIKVLTVTLTMKIKVDNIEIVNTVRKVVKIDNQAPVVLDNFVSQNSDINSKKERKIEFDLSDKDGSGIKEYAILTTNDCDSMEYQQKKKNANTSRVTEYLGNGTYYICVTDKVENKNRESAVKFEINNVDKNPPAINEFSIKSKNTKYNQLQTELTIKVTDDLSLNELKMCISNNANTLSNCKWENYVQKKDWTVSGSSLDGKERIVYIVVVDTAGNASSTSVKYTPYKECSSLTSKQYLENWTTCSVPCGGGTQTRKYNLLDKYTSKVCKSETDTRKCNEQDCCLFAKMSGVGEWSACSERCGGGEQFRDVYLTSIFTGQSCGIKKDGAKRQCNTQGCCEKTKAKREEWSGCSVSCGTGIKTRTVKNVSLYKSDLVCSTTTEEEKCSISCSSSSDSGGGGGGSISCCDYSSGVYDSTTGNFDSNSHSPSEYESNNPSPCSGPGC